MDRMMIAELEENLANASYAHEYALMKLNKAKSRHEEEEVDEELSYYTAVYFETRKQLEAIDRDRLCVFETELAWQKNATLRGVSI